MSGLDFKTVFAGVRPGRLAILIDRSDPDWQETCRRLMECLSSIWGGKYSVLIPTDGSTIDSRFWDVLEAFDPDYICEYSKTGLDLKIAFPEKYQQLLQRQLEGALPNAPPADDVRDAFDKRLERARLHSQWVSLDLQKELKTRLAPFFFETKVLNMPSLAARAGVGYPLTDVATVIPYIDHPSRMSIVRSTSSGIPPLWIEATTGATFEERMNLLTTERITIEEAIFDDSRVSELFDIVMKGGVDTGRSRIAAHLTGSDYEPAPDYLAASPFQFSMLGLSEYRMLDERTWDAPVVVVLGYALDDFALYFNLSRMRPNVYWLLPQWLAASKAALSGGPDRKALTPSETHASRFAWALLAAARDEMSRPIEFVSVSCPPTELSAAVDDLSAASGYDMPPTIRELAHLADNVRDLLSHPRIVFNTDNFAVPTTLQVLDGKAAGFFPTPKPKGFVKIEPYKHRWITELRLDALDYPRHSALGGAIIKHPALSTKEVRAGARGVCYFCPNIGYQGGDVDTILVRPQLNLLNGAAVFERLAATVGWRTAISDKGSFSRDAVGRLGGLEMASTLIRNPRHFAVLREFLKDGKDESARGMYLASDRRRYLDLLAVRGILEDEGEAVSLLDLLIDKTLLHRGTILKCEYCRNADWIAVGELSDEFRCKRCRRSQRLLRKHALERAEPTWYYQLDEIAYQGFLNDMQVPILALDYLRRISTSFVYADELELWKPDLPKPYLEIDLCCVCSGKLTIGEAKTTQRIEGGGRRERRSLAKYREAALGLGVRRFVLATSEQWSLETIANAEHAFAGTGVEVLPLEGRQILVPT